MRAAAGHLRTVSQTRTVWTRSVATAVGAPHRHSADDERGVAVWWDERSETARIMACMCILRLVRVSGKENVSAEVSRECLRRVVGTAGDTIRVRNDVVAHGVILLYGWVSR